MFFLLYFVVSLCTSSTNRAHKSDFHDRTLIAPTYQMNVLLGGGCNNKMCMLAEI